MTKRTKVFIIIGILIILVLVLYKLQIIGAHMLLNLSHGVLLPAVIVASLIDSVNPCAISVLLLTIAFLYSLGRARSGILKTGGAYIFGIFIVYILIGLGILRALTFFNVPHFMAKIGAVVLIIFGLVDLINDFFPKFPIKLGIPNSAHTRIGKLIEKSAGPTAFVLGAVVGLYEFPCTGGPYLLILGLLHDRGTFWSGFAYLVLYNIIFVLPLVVILMVASEQAFLEKVQIWKSQNNKNMRFWGGLLMVALGVIIFLL